MEAQFFDFAILGDSHPEGLYLAAGLARRGFSVGIIPSVELGELPAQFPWPLRLPERIGEKRFDELLFRVGFFRLEESGLSPVPFQSQFVLKKNRLSFNGAAQSWDQELKREFPRQAERLIRIRDAMRRSSVRNTPKAMAQLSQVLREDSELRDWVIMDGGNGRSRFHENSSRLKPNWERWLWNLAWPETKFYKLHPKVGQSFSPFLIEHAKKWGAQVVEGPIQLETKFRHFHLKPELQARNLVVNTLGAFRLLAKTKPERFSHQITHWMYFDRVSCDPDEIPEPLEELCYFHFSETDEFPYLLHSSRTKLKEKAQLTLGVWLPFQDSSAWHSKIEQGRSALRRFLPFLSESAFPKLPSALELSELKGECVRRGEMERLIVSEVEEGGWKKLRQKSMAVFQRNQKLPKLASRIYLSMPYLRFHSDRQDSLKSCHQFLEHFEKRRAKLGASKLW